MRPLPRPVPLSLLLAAATALTACGSGDDPRPAAAVSPSATPSSSPSSSPTPSASPSPAAVPQRLLPRGGRSVFPEHVVVAYYGTAGTDALGVLGKGTPVQAAAALTKAAAPFGPLAGRKVLPALELITTVATSAPGEDGDFSRGLADKEVQAFLDVARAQKMLLILDFQPGRAEFLAQVKRYEKFLVQPDVGLALDPEWKLYPGQKPLGQIGYTTAAKVNEVSAYVAGLVARERLPEKLFLVHQFRTSMVRNREQLATPKGLEMVVHVDGNGSPALKRQAYGVLSLKKGELHNGFKLFYEKDTDLLSPREAMALRPRPELITYQ